MKAWLYIMPLLALVACSTGNRGLFSKQTPHEKYTGKLTAAGLNNTTLGTQWLHAANTALQSPLPRNLPFSETGFFAAERPTGIGYSFTAHRGQQLLITFNMVTDSSLTLFADLWRQRPGNQPAFIAAADTTLQTLTYDVEEDATFILRLQPELLQNGRYTVQVNTQASLAFPIPAGNNATVSSLWGADRDGGARRHEGIDIFAKKRTPVIAIASGYVTSVREGGLGGKVVFMRPQGKNYTLYYAHLDEQLVTDGQQVQQGDTLGLVGNTGNARTTGPHLHFGIYTSGGAVDPYPFVNPKTPAIPAIAAPVSHLNTYIQPTKETAVYAYPDAARPLLNVQARTPLQVTSLTGQWYKVLLPDATEGFIKSNNTTVVTPRTQAVTQDALLTTLPAPNATPKHLVIRGSTLSVLGRYSSYTLVNANGITGWTVL